MRERALHITWVDGHTSVYSLEYLRGFCPCAQCQGHGAGSWVWVQPAAPLLLEHIEELGNYALGMRWSDGHSTGIYSWDILRELCPCAACREQLGPAHAATVMPAAAAHKV